MAPAALKKLIGPLRLKDVFICVLKNPFESHQPINYYDFFASRSFELFHLYEKLTHLPQSIWFKFTDKQSKCFTEYFQSLLEKNQWLLSRDMDANIKKVGRYYFSNSYDFIRFADNGNGDR